jgi:hypothetical protein
MASKSTNLPKLLHKRNFLSIILGTIVITIFFFLRNLLSFASFYWYVHIADISNAEQVKNFQTSPPLIFKFISSLQYILFYLAPIVGGFVAVQKAKNQRILISALSGVLWIVFISISSIALLYFYFMSIPSRFQQNPVAYAKIQQTYDQQIQGVIQSFPKSMLLTILLSGGGGLLLQSYLFKKSKPQHS